MGNKSGNEREKYEKLARDIREAPILHDKKYPSGRAYSFAVGMARSIGSANFVKKFFREERPVPYLSPDELSTFCSVFLSEHPESSQGWAFGQALSALIQRSYNEKPEDAIFHFEIGNRKPQNFLTRLEGFPSNPITINITGHLGDRSLLDCSHVHCTLDGSLRDLSGSGLYACKLRAKDVSCYSSFGESLRFCDIDIESIWPSENNSQSVFHRVKNSRLRVRNKLLAEYLGDCDGCTFDINHLASSISGIKDSYLIVRGYWMGELDKGGPCIRDITDTQILFHQRETYEAFVKTLKPLRWHDHRSMKIHNTELALVSPGRRIFYE